MVEQAEYMCCLNSVVNALKVVGKVGYPLCSTYIHIPTVISAYSVISIPKSRILSYG